jgi:hypothetical protein
LRHAWGSAQAMLGAWGSLPPRCDRSGGVGEHACDMLGALLKQCSGHGGSLRSRCERGERHVMANPTPCHSVSEETACARHRPQPRFANAIDTAEHFDIREFGTCHCAIVTLNGAAHPGCAATPKEKWGCPRGNNALADLRHSFGFRGSHLRHASRKSFFCSFE